MAGVPRYDRFLLVNKIGRDQVLRRYFTPEERWCWVAGVLGTAADAPIRGWLLLTEKIAADAKDIADAAGVDLTVAESSLQKATKFGLVEHDDTVGCLWVPDWEMYNPPSPKTDHTAAERKRRERERKAQMGECHADVTPDVTPSSHASRHALQGSKKETKEGTTANAVENDARPDLDQLCELLADEIEGNGSKRPAVTKAWREACRLLVDNDGRSVEEVRRAIVWCQADDFWRANVLSMPTLRKQFDKMRLQAERQRPRLRAVAEHPASRRIREIDDLREMLPAEEVA